MTFDVSSALVSTQLAGLPRRQGKVRDVYDLGDQVLLVATDRISAYDVVLPTPIPGKGRLLTQISKFWFDFLAETTKHHLLEVLDDRMPAGLEKYREQLRGRTMRCLKAEVVPIECVVRGYLAGSGWKDYVETGSVCGIRLPAGLRQCERLSEPIFTPATKVDHGHDQNISFDQACESVGSDVMRTLRARSMEIYQRAADFARRRGIIIADTKFEWGRIGNDLVLIDEALTPDSSRFWPADRYQIGRDQESFDKQFVRNYLTTLVEAGQWNKLPPGPELPEDTVRQTAAKYREAYEFLCRDIHR